jgi:hypothetical protein
MKALLCSIITAFLACPVVFAHGGHGGGGFSGGHGSFGGHSFSHSSFSHTSFGGTSHYSGFGHSSFSHSSFGAVSHAGFSTIPSTFTHHGVLAPSAHSLGAVESVQAAAAGNALHAGFLAPNINPTHLDRVPLTAPVHHGLMSGIGHGFARFFGFGNPQRQIPTALMTQAAPQFVHPTGAFIGGPVSAFPFTQSLAVAMFCSPAFMRSGWMYSPYEYAQTNNNMYWNNFNSWNNWYGSPLPATSFYSPYFAYPGLDALDATLAEAFIYPTFEPFPYFGQYFDRLDPAPWFLPGPNAISNQYPVPLGTPFPVAKLDESQMSQQPSNLGDGGVESSKVIDPQLVPFDMSAAAH